MLFAVTGAAAEARAATIFSGFQPAAVRRRATVLTIAGIAAALAGCVALSIISVGETGDVLRVAAAPLLTGGLGAGLGGIVSLAVTSGARYAADRLASLDQD